MSIRWALQNIVGHPGTFQRVFYEYCEFYSLHTLFFNYCIVEKYNLQPSLKINVFLYFAATEHCMCWRPLYGSGLMWDFWLMFNRQPVSNCRAMTCREPAGYRTNTHTNARKTLICTTSSLLPCSRVCVTIICMNHTHSIQTSCHPVCPDTGRLFLNCNLSVSFILLA